MRYNSEMIEIIKYEHMRLNEVHHQKILKLYFDISVDPKVHLWTNRSADFEITAQYRQHSSHAHFDLELTGIQYYVWTTRINIFKPWSSVLNIEWCQLFESRESR